MLRNIFLLVFRKIAQPFRNLPIRIKIGKLYPLEFVYNLLVKRIVKPNDIIEVMGHKMFLDSKDALRLSIYGIYEPFETELLKKLIKKNNIIIDVGANIGYYTLIATKCAGKNGKVYAFEPDPTNFAILKKNANINGYNNIILTQKAISNKTGKAKLYLCTKNTADHKIYDDGTNRKFIEIDSIRLDDFFKNFNEEINLIKIDTQGAEGHVLQGMISLIERNKNIKIIIEFWPSGLQKDGFNPKDLLMSLKKHGFNLYIINEKSERLEPVNIDSLLKQYVSEARGHPSLLCIRSTKAIYCYINERQAGRL